MVPNYNYGRYLRRRFQSILDQTFSDYEVIFVDNASTDDSRDVYGEFARDPRFRAQFNEVNNGNVFKQWNIGVGLARGEFVWIAESDDWSEPGFLARMVELLDASPAAGVAFCASWYVEEEASPRLWTWYWPEDMQPLMDRDFVMHGRDACMQHLVRMPLIPNASAAVFRRQVFLDAGGADATYRIAGDQDVWFRLLLRSDLAYCATPMNHWRRQPAAVSSGRNDTHVLVAEAYRIVAAISHAVPVEAGVLDAACNALANGWMGETLRPRQDRRLRLRPIIAAAWRADPWLCERWLNKMAAHHADAPSFAGTVLRRAWRLAGPFARLGRSRWNRLRRTAEEASRRAGGPAGVAGGRA